MFSIFDLDFKDSWLSSKESDEVLQDMITKKKRCLVMAFTLLWIVVVVLVDTVVCLLNDCPSSCHS